MLVLVLFVAIPAQSQILKELDTLDVVKLVDELFIDHDIDNYAIRVFSNYKYKNFKLSNEDSKVRYIPRNRFGVGFGFSSRKVLIDIAFNIKGDSEDYTRRFDMQGTTIVGKKNYVNFYVQTYRGFDAKTNYGEPTVFRDDVRSVTIGANVLHTIPEIEFSFSLLKAGLDDLEKKFYISGGFGAFWFYDYFSADGDVLPDNSDAFFNDEAHIKRYNSTAVGMLGGVLSVFKLPYNLIGSCNLMPGVGLMYKHVTLQDDTYRPSKPFIYKLDYSVAIGYNVERYYISLIYGGGMYTTSLNFDNLYRFDLTKAKIAFGYKLGNRNKHK